jgi:hypothetical protein
MLNHPNVNGGGYMVGSYASLEWRVSASGPKGMLVNPTNVGLAPTFMPANRNVTQLVNVVSLNDLAADGEKGFNVEAPVARDAYGYAPEGNFHGAAVCLPFLNKDGEKATVGNSATHVGALVAEPYFFDSPRIEV